MPSSKALIATSLLVALSSGHVSLENPKPYVFVADGKVNPLESSGRDFPCRIPPGQRYEIDGEPTPMAIGEDQFLSFSGHAVHGGGSCQIALSKGFPTKDSSWKVIHSIEGGCPARHQKGNLEGPNVDKYFFQIPEGIETGQNWTLAWTWFPRVGGQPEIYMNCAPITVLPSKPKKRMSLPERRQSLSVSRRDDGFPELFMANLGDLTGGCTTNQALTAQIPIAFPNPGPSVERPEGDNLFKQPCDGNPRAKKAAGGGDDQGGSSAPSSTSTSTSSSSDMNQSSTATATSVTTVVVTPISRVSTFITVTRTSSAAPSSSSDGSNGDYDDDDDECPPGFDPEEPQPSANGSSERP
ncbi:hypothetical protein F5Y17DRAFT_425963 [Xylariaceae sp. FL0594]|nr:hypothetical protein F5Y17DRAFT_425963 [Xylariaceae sp. FL0594]